MGREGSASTAEAPLIVIVDDDDGMREGIRDVLLSVGMESISFASTAQMLAAPLPDRHGCLILDVRLPGSSGLDLQTKLNATGSKLPIVFMSGYADVKMSVKAMKAGAADFLTKPFRDQELLDAVNLALEQDRVRRSEDATRKEIVSRAADLTPREQQIMAGVVNGLLNKTIAFNLGISEVTVKIHRGNLMRKMQADSIADLVRKYDILRDTGVI